MSLSLSEMRFYPEAAPLLWGSALYTVVYQYRIPREKSIEYVKLEKRAIEVYLELGCLKVELYRDEKDPRRWLEIDRFSDVDHYKEVSSTIREDPRITDLWNKLQELLGPGNYRPTKRTYLQML
jgi:quinol monooxygenase YgiN